MHTLLSFLLLSSPVLLPSQKSIPATSKITEVTVFFNGAEVSRSGQVNIPSGNLTLLLEDLSPALDEKSLQFTSNGNVSVLSTSFEVAFEAEKEAQKQETGRLNDQLKTLGETVKTKRDLLAVSRQEQQLLLNNANYDQLKGITVAELEQAINFAKNRLIAIKQTQQKLRLEIDKLNRDRQKIINQLQEVRIAQARPKGQVSIKLKSERAQTLNFELRYTIAEAGWRPYYDIKVTDISKPLQLAYKAKINQSSGEDWKQVKLRLSTGNPAEAAALADLEPWFLNFVNSNWRSYNPPQKPAPRGGFTGTFKGIVVDAQSSEAIPFANVVALNPQGHLINGTTTDMNGNFNLQLSSAAQRLEVSFLGYQKATQYLSKETQFYNIRLQAAAETLGEVVIQYQRPLVEKTKTSTIITSEDIQNMAVRDVSSIASQAAGVTYDRYGNSRVRGARENGNAVYIDGVKVEFKISQNPVNLNFDVALPYDVPSNGEEYQVQVENYELPAAFSYTAIPKLHENAFLTASLTDWERLNLLDGAAGLYLEGTYLGETQINVSEAEDTLTLSLGKDENIKVLREAVKTKEGSSFLGGKRSKRFQYRIAVRNTKPVPLQLTLLDQYPVSGHSEIKVKRLEHSGGKLNEETGIISWEMELQPKESKKLELLYEVSYPKGRRINL